MLSWKDKVHLSLIASGAESGRIESYAKRIDELAAQAREATAGLGPSDKADHLLQFLHSNALKTYRFEQTRVDVLLDTGTFNCVSSAVIFNLLAESLGLKTAAVSTPDHAFSQIILPDRTVDVETTSALGFDPGQKRTFHDAFGKLTGFAYVPPGNYARRTSLDDRGLIALILQNLMTQAQSRGDEATPVGLAWDNAALLGTPAAQTLLLRSYQNYLAGLNDRGEYTKGLDILSRLEALLGRSRETEQLFAAFGQNLIVGRLDSGDFAGAKEAVKSWGTRTTRSPAEWYSMILKTQAQKLYQERGWAASFAWISAQKSAEPGDVSAVSLSLALQELEKRSAQGDWAAALAFLANLPADIRSKPEVVKFGDILAYNGSVEYHNRFVSLMNQRQTDQATAVLQEGLGRFPDSTVLQADKRKLASIQRR
ncbi:MAG TPA: hypothetical protein VMW87_12065 [Spirochaetia bacterium]|nr:hypothetical protein [Spirochaetia bacterium]